MKDHIDNAMEMLLQGLQNLGQLMNIAARNSNEFVVELNTIGTFISTIDNLTEALNNFRLNTGFEEDLDMKQH